MEILPESHTSLSWSHGGSCRESIIALLFVHSIEAVPILESPFREVPLYKLLEGMLFLHAFSVLISLYISDIHGYFKTLDLSFFYYFFLKLELNFNFFSSHPTTSTQRRPAIFLVEQFIDNLHSQNIKGEMWLEILDYN